jgi:hypothetical protein
MNNNQWFIFGDVISNGFIGVVSAWLCALWFEIGDNMLIAMLLGMLVPMLLSMPFALIFGRYFGALEIMLPMMLTSMLAGMVSAMLATMYLLTAFQISFIGIVCGFGVLGFVSLLNYKEKII